MKRFQGGLVFKAHRLLYHSTLGSRVIKTKKGTVVTLPPRRARIYGSHTLVSLNLRLKDLLGPVTRVKKKKRRILVSEVSGVGPPCTQIPAFYLPQKRLQKRGRVGRLVTLTMEPLIESRLRTMSRGSQPSH